MKGRWIPFLATTACLALAAAAPAQDRGRRGGGGGSERSSRSSGGDRGGSRPERSSPDRSSSPSRTRESRPDRSQSPSRTDPGGWNSGRERQDRMSRSSDNRPNNDRPGRTGDQGSRPSGGDSRPSRSGNGESRDRGDRRNPFGGSIGGWSGDRDRRSDSRNDRSPSGDRFGRNGGFDRGRPSRSGVVSYGTVHNGFGNVRPTRYGGGFNHASFGRNVHRSRPVGVNLVFGGYYGGLRYGYVGYSSGWRDDYFCYPFYVFDPWAPGVNYVASPWYRYSYLPPYLNTSRVTIVNNYYSSWDSTDGWRDYDYRADDRARRNEDIDSALDDIRDAFERNSDRYTERLLPQSGQVAIFNDGKYDYSLGADDFQDMFLDGIQQSKTVKYEIVESRVKGDEVHLRARHEFTDSWGENQVAFHTYTLRREQGGRYVIREFGTD